MRNVRVGFLFSLILLTGCAYHPQPVVAFGASGAQFSAPSLCEAVLACAKSGETACYYNSSVLQTATGNVDAEKCVEVAK